MTNNMIGDIQSCKLKKSCSENYSSTRFSYISIDIDKFAIQNVMFLDANKNKIIHGTFSNLIYTSPNVTFNGLYLNIPLYPGYSQKISDNTSVAVKMLKSKFNNLHPTDGSFTPLSSTMDNWRSNCTNASIESSNIDIVLDLDVLHKLDKIEYEIIESYKTFFNNKKTSSYQLKSFFRDSVIKNNFALISNESILTTTNPFYIQTENAVILKISGIWETKSNLGINFKFMKTY